MDSNKLKIIIVFVLGAFFAIYLGIAAATAQIEAAMWVIGVATFVLMLALGKNVWAVIPVAAAFAGGITLLPGFPQPWYAATPIVAAFIAMRYLMRSDMFMFRWTWIDTFMVLQIGALLQAYFRNPSGIAIFGGDIYGGRPYFDYGIAITCYFLLAFIKTDIEIYKKVAIIIIIANLGDDLLRAATNLSGGFARIIGKFYTNVDYQSFQEGTGFVFDADTRFGGFMAIGITLALLCFSFRRPITCALPIPLWPFICICASVTFIFFSGFRSALIRFGFYFIAGSLVRKKPLDLIVAGIVGFVLLLVFGSAFGLSSLPFSMQRTLSFLPFEVSAEAKISADASADWRFEIWRIVLTSDKYIQNKLLGDGFGYSRAEHEAQIKAMEGTGHYAGDSIDMFIAKGSYHGWHVEAIRFTGVLGLITGIFLLFGFAFYAWQVIKHYRYTPYMPYVLFICMPFLIEPFFHLFVFGSYKSTFIELISAAGIVRVLDNLRVRDLAAARASLPVAQPVQGLFLRGAMQTLPLGKAR